MYIVVRLIILGIKDCVENDILKSVVFLPEPTLQRYFPSPGICTLSLYLNQMSIPQCLTI